MKKFNYDGHVFKLTSKRQGVAYPWDGKYQKEHHRIFVVCDDVKVQFEYYCNEIVLGENDLLNALYCFMLDITAYNNARDINDFAAEFGYTKVSECMRAYKGCKAAAEKWKKLRTDIDMHEFTNWLQIFNRYEVLRRREP